MLVMLDLDNTLGDRAAAVEAWLDEFATEHGLDTETTAWIAALDADGYSSRSDVFAAIRHRLALDTPVDELVAAYRRRVVELSRPTDGARDCLVALRAAGHRLAIVTNGSTGQQRAKIQRFGFAPLVDAIVVSEEAGIKKPDPDIFHLAAEQTDASLEGAWMVGDSPVHDIVAARRLGLCTIWVHRGRAWPVEHGDPPTYTVATPAEVPALVNT